MSESDVIIKKRRGRPPLPVPEGLTKEEWERQKRNARWMKWYNNMSNDRRKEYNRDRHTREKLRQLGFGQEIEALDREVEEETGDFVV